MFVTVVVQRPWFLRVIFTRAKNALIYIHDLSYHSVTNSQAPSFHSSQQHSAIRPMSFPFSINLFVVSRYSPLLSSHISRFLNRTWLNIQMSDRALGSERQYRGLRSEASVAPWWCPQTINLRFIVPMRGRDLKRFSTSNQNSLFLHHGKWKSIVTRIQFPSL